MEDHAAVNATITSRRCAMIFATFIAVMAAAGCMGVRRSEPITGPISLNDPHLQRGRASFERYCYRCHTEGEGGMGPIINDKPLPKFLMKFQVRHGLGVMPKFPPEVIPDEQLDEIVDYIVALRHQG
jgi:mono/diheme cytochrome c family protein